MRDTNVTQSYGLVIAKNTNVARLMYDATLLDRCYLDRYDVRGGSLRSNASPKVSDSGAAMKFEFCMLKNTTQADF